MEGRIILSMKYGNYWKMEFRELYLIIFGSIIAYIIASSIVGIMWIQTIIRDRRERNEDR